MGLSMTFLRQVIYCTSWVLLSLTGTDGLLRYILHRLFLHNVLVGVRRLNGQRTPGPKRLSLNMTANLLFWAIGDLFWDTFSFGVEARLFMPSYLYGNNLQVNLWGALHFFRGTITGRTICTSVGTLMGPLAIVGVRRCET